MWSDLYLRHEWRIPSLSQRMIEAMNNLKIQTRALIAHSDRLLRRIRELSKLLGKSDDEIYDLLNFTEKSEVRISTLGAIIAEMWYFLCPFK